MRLEVLKVHYEKLLIEDKNNGDLTSNVFENSTKFMETVVHKLMEKIKHVIYRCPNNVLVELVKYGRNE